MGDETKARNLQDQKYRITTADGASPLNVFEDMRDLRRNKDAGTATYVPKMESVQISSRGVESPTVKDSDNTKDLSRYNSLDNVRAALRELQSPTKASNFDEDASTSKQMPKNSKDKGADSKSLSKTKRPDATNPLRRPGPPKRKKLSREVFYKGKLSNVVFGSHQPSSTSDSEDSSIASVFSSS